MVQNDFVPYRYAIGSVALVLFASIFAYWVYEPSPLPPTAKVLAGQEPSPAVVVASASDARCVGAADAIARMMGPQIARVTAEDGWVVYRFGPDYEDWTSPQREAMVRTIADADACANGGARKLEFQSPGGTVVARADALRGIRMTA